MVATECEETMSVVGESLRMTGLFEAELLLELMLRYWDHPLSDDSTFRNDLLEKATEMLRLAASGTKVLEGISPRNMNLVAAVWCAESTDLAGPVEEIEFADQRQQWLDTVRHAVPSCFCDPDLLP
jgi:hypothetical protein